MNAQRLWIQTTLIFGLLCIAITAVYADRNDKKRYERKEQVEQRRDYRQRHNITPPKGYSVDKHYNNYRVYPDPGYRISKLPSNYYRYHHHDRDYFFQGGVWYSWQDGRYIVIRPGIGWFIPVLPSFYTTIWFSGIPYYYVNDVYYTWNPGLSGYVVTNPPSGINPQEPPPVLAEQLYIYPMKGQSEQQQANDRYACHAWAVKQTTFDPSQPPANMTQSELNDLRLEYRRAIRACLEGRGYSVR